LRVTSRGLGDVYKRQSLCNAKNLAASLEDAYGEMFRRWQLQSGAPR
jgi:hypothetical protein